MQDGRLCDWYAEMLKWEEQPLRFDHIISMELHLVSGQAVAGEESLSSGG